MRHVEADDLVERPLLEERPQRGFPLRSRGRAPARAPLCLSAAITAPMRCSFKLRRSSTTASSLGVSLRDRRRAAGLLVGHAAARAPGAPGSAGASGSGGRSARAPDDGEPALSAAEELLDLVVAHPVVLVVVQDRDEHVEVREQLGRAACVPARRDGEVAARAPLGVLLVERVLCARAPRSRAARRAAAGAPRRRGRAGRRAAPRAEARAPPAPAAPCCARRASVRTAPRSRRSGTTSDVGPIVDVLLESPVPRPRPFRPRTSPTGSTSSSSAAVQRSARPPDRRRAPSRRRARTRARERVLVQEVAQVRGRGTRVGDRQQHRLPLLGMIRGLKE